MSKRNILFTGLEIAFEYNSRTGLSTIRLIYVMLRSWHISESHGKKLIVNANANPPLVSTEEASAALSDGMIDLLYISALSSTISNPMRLKASIISGSQRLPYVYFHKYPLLQNIYVNYYILTRLAIAMANVIILISL